MATRDHFAGPSEILKPETNTVKRKQLFIQHSASTTTASSTSTGGMNNKDVPGHQAPWTDQGGRGTLSPTGLEENLLDVDDMT